MAHNSLSFISLGDVVARRRVCSRELPKFLVARIKTEAILRQSFIYKL